jgi:acetyl esterase
MKSIGFSTLTVVLLFSYSIVSAQSRSYPPVIENASHTVTYKVVDDFELRLWIFNPPNHQSSDTTAAIVFFFGGGWNNGSPSQLVKQCEYLAARGMVAITADYRVRSRNGVAMDKCVSDAKSAIRWVREHSSEYGIDPDRIAASGGSAGGHLAAATAVLPKFDEPDENLEISSKPNALILFNPAVFFASTEEESATSDANEERANGRGLRFGANPEDLSPYHNLTEGAPPTIILSGTNDRVISMETLKLYGEKMREIGSECILVAYQGEPHGFFNWGMKNNGPYIATTYQMDQFLVSVGFLEAPPESVIYEFK